MLVKDIMTKDVITVSEDDSLHFVGKTLKEKRISGIPVVNSFGQVVGIITLTDVWRIISSIYKWSTIDRTKDIKDLNQMFLEETKKHKVSDYMTKNVFVLSEYDKIEDIMQIMFNNNVHTLPVVKDGKLVGVIGRRDLIYNCF